MRGGWFTVCVDGVGVVPTGDDVDEPELEPVW